MKIGSALALTLLAGTAVAQTTSVSADFTDPATVTVLKNQPIPANVRTFVPGGREIQQNRGESFGSRAFAVTYNNYDLGTFFTFLGQAAATGAGNKDFSDDVSFVGGPWATAGPGRIITNLNVAPATVVATPVGQDFDLRIQLWDEDAHDFAGQAGVSTDQFADPATAGNLLFTFYITGFSFPANQGATYADPGFDITDPTAVPPFPGVEVPADDTEIAIRISIGQYDSVNDAWTTQTNHALTGTYIFGTVTETPFNTVAPYTFNAADYQDTALVGSSEISWGREAQNDTVGAASVDGFPFATIATTSGTNDPANPSKYPERRAGFFQTPGGTPTPGTPIAIRFINAIFYVGGDFVAVAPACEAFTLGAANAFASDVETSTATKWYCVTLSGPATDTNLTYVDFDTEGSATNAAIGLFNADGQLIRFDDDSGSGTNAQLSFGIGNRLPVGDGETYDGRSWDARSTPFQLGLAAGTYYVAVVNATSGASFGDGFTATGTATGGSKTLRVRTNAGSSAIDPSVAPRNTVLGPPAGIAGAVSGDLTELFGPDVLWYSFNVCQDPSANPVTLAMDETTGLVHGVTVFNSLGNVVGSAIGTPASPAQFVLNSGTAGTYYAALTYTNQTGDTEIDLAPDPTNNGRWHFRPRAGDGGFEFRLTVITPATTCGNTCDGIDFNGDGIEQDPTDIEAFLSVYSGGPCVPPEATCGDIDFNNDGIEQDPTDIEAFLSVYSGGPCL